MDIGDGLDELGEALTPIEKRLFNGIEEAYENPERAARKARKWVAVARRYPKATVAVTTSILVGLFVLYGAVRPVLVGPGAARASAGVTATATISASASHEASAGASVPGPRTAKPRHSQSNSTPPAGTTSAPADMAPTQERRVVLHPDGYLYGYGFPPNGSLDIEFSIDGSDQWCATTPTDGQGQFVESVSDCVKRLRLSSVLLRIYEGTAVEWNHLIDLRAVLRALGLDALGNLVLGPAR